MSSWQSCTKSEREGERQSVRHLSGSEILVIVFSGHKPLIKLHTNRMQLQNSSNTQSIWLWKWSSISLHERSFHSALWRVLLSISGKANQIQSISLKIYLFLVRVEKRVSMSLKCIEVRAGDMQQLFTLLPFVLKSFYFPIAKICLDVVCAHPKTIVSWRE